MSHLDLIIGTYSRINSLKTPNGGLYYFIKSLRKVNNLCKVVVFCEKEYLNKELIHFCKNNNVDIFYNFHLNYWMMYSRFEIYIKYIQDICKKENINKILITDMNDVIFQSDPFQIKFNYFYPALEINKHGFNNKDNIYDARIAIQKYNLKEYSEWINSLWLEELKYLNYDKNILKNKYIICAGTILGDKNTILNFLYYYIKILKSHKYHANDQAVLNIFSYKNNFNYNYYNQSKILTLDNIQFHSLKKNKKGLIINNNNELYSIIHQINRCNIDYMKNLVDNLL